MNSADIWKYFSVAVASAVKFVGGPVTGVALGLHWFETAVCTLAGMMFSVLVVTYLGTAIQLLLRRWRKGTARRFTRRTRRAIRIKQRFGMRGIAFLTPLLFTPIGGTAIAVAFRIPRPHIFFWMLVSGTFWGIVFSYLAYRLKFLEGWFS
jgi:hypothetical protein